MSRIYDIGRSLEDLGEKLPKVLHEYEALMDEAESQFQLKGKTLEKANKENPAYHVYYAQKASELKTLVVYIESLVNATRGRMFKQLKQKNPLDLNEREIAKFIDCEPKYLSFHELYLEVKEVYNKFQNLADGFTTRGYALNNITKARIAEVHNIEL